MLDLVRNPEDRFSHDAAQVCEPAESNPAFEVSGPQREIIWIGKKYGSVIVVYEKSIYTISKP